MFCQCVGLCVADNWNRCTCSLLGWDINQHADSNAVGEPNANCEAMIVDENTNEEIKQRGPDARGELWCRAPNVMKGYGISSSCYLACLSQNTDTTSTATGRTPKQQPKH
jgi:acyl-CoA synthetase (AMP-forming)/AMP-acid ligase II